MRLLFHASWEDTLFMERCFSNRDLLGVALHFSNAMKKVIKSGMPLKFLLQLTSPTVLPHGVLL